MASTPFDYAAPKTLNEAISLLQERENAALLAGGHELLPALKLRERSVSLLVDLRRVAELRGIQHRNGHGGFQLGAMTTLTDLLASHDLRGHYQVLMEALESVGDVQVRNRATLGGSLAAGEQASDLAAAALVCDATVNVVDASGSRAVPVEELVGTPSAALGRTGIIASVDLAPSKAGTGGAYEKLKNPATCYPICGAAAQVVRGADGTIESCRVAVTGAAAAPVRLRALESALEGKAPSAASLSAAAARARDELACVTDFYASAEYRSHLAGALSERALARACQRAGFPALAAAVRPEVVTPAVV